MTGIVLILLSFNFVSITMASLVFMDILCPLQRFCLVFEINDYCQPFEEEMAAYLVGVGHILDNTYIVWSDNP